jgi:hypothetical protein
VSCCCAVRSRTADSGSLRYSLGMVVWRHMESCMLLIVGAIIALITVVIIPRVRVPGGVNGSALGWMSEQWLAEHRASHSA